MNVVVTVDRCDGDGEVQREGRRAIYEPPTGVVWRSDKERCGGGQRVLGFRQN